MRALKVLEATPPNDLVLAMALNGLGIVRLKQNRLAEALPHLERAKVLVEPYAQGGFSLRASTGGQSPKIRAEIKTVH